MAVIYLVLLVLVSGEASLANNAAAQTSALTKYTHSRQDIVIPVMLHLDRAMTRQAPKMKGTRKKLKFYPKMILREVERTFNKINLNQKIYLKLVNVKAISNRTVTVDQNVSKYLKSYCDWQKGMKIMRGRHYFSALLTGLDLYYVGKKGEKVRESTGRGYMSKMCSIDKSCAVIRWHKQDLVYLLAHEIAHSLGVYHDGTKNRCSNGFIMSARYSRQKIPQHWSSCSKTDLQKFLRSKKKSWCIRPKVNRSARLN